MNGLYRIVTPAKDDTLGMIEQNTSPSELRLYTDRLIKLIPSEVIGLYLVGSGIIPDPNKAALLAWAIVCLAAVIITRFYGTKSDADPSPQWQTIIISSISFIIWLYQIGGPFLKYGIHVPWLASLIMVGWTFFVPFFYKGATD